MHILITGSTRGIGFGLAKQFLEAGWMVTINGRSAPSVQLALEKLTDFFPDAFLEGVVGDVSKIDDVQEIWKRAVQGQGQIDIWLNNAGIDQIRENIWEMDYQNLKSVIEINLLGTVNGSQVAVKEMLKQGFGQIYNMEGYGSNGMIMPKMTVYGMTKRAITYFTKSLAKEVKNTPIKVCLLSPGMVLTDLLKDSQSSDQKEAQQFKRIFNILGDTVETVTSFLASKMINNQQNAAHFVWLTKRKMFFRFIKSLFSKRKIF